MTLPDERYSAVSRAREFLLALLDPKKTPKVPLSVRKQASSVLRHFPGEWEMESLVDGTTSIERMFGEK